MTDENKIRIMIVDDHPMSREGIRSFLSTEPDMNVVGEASDGEEACLLASELKPDVILMDVGMPKIDGLLATRKIKENNDDILIIALTAYNDEEHASSSWESGVEGYLLKTADRSEIVCAIRSVRNGDIVFDRKIAGKLLNRTKKPKPIDLPFGEKLTSREIQILKLVAEGKNNQYIAKNLNISPRTVKSHLVYIFEKIDCKTRTEAVVKSMKCGWLS